jgi:hypothetical protein
LPLGCVFAALPCSAALQCSTALRCSTAVPWRVLFNRC